MHLSFTSASSAHIPIILKYHIKRMEKKKYKKALEKLL